MRNKNVKRLIILSAITSLGFLVPIEMVLFSSKNLSLSQIYLLYSIFSVMIMFLEVPTGYFGDRFGHKKSIIVGLLFGTLGLCGFIIGSGFLIISISYFFMALMISFISGSDIALLYDSLAEYKQENEFENVYAKINSFSYATGIIGGIIGGVVAGIDITLNPLLDIICLVIGLVAVITVSQPKQVDEDVDESKGIVRMFNECKSIFLILIIAGLFMTSTLIGTKFSQPLMIEASIPIGFFGVFTAVNAIVNSIASYLTPKLKNVSFITIILLPSLIILCLGVFNNGYLVVLLFITSASRSVGNIKIATEINKKISSKYRATINSMKSLLFRLFYSVIILGAGLFADDHLYTTIGCIGILLIFMLGVLTMIYTSKNQKVSESLNLYEK